MIQRLVGIVIGGCVTFLLLILFDDGRILSEQYVGFLTAVVIGGLVNAFWPLIWRLMMARRARVRHDEAVRAEAQRQVDARQRERQPEEGDGETPRRTLDLGPSPLDE